MKKSFLLFLCVAFLFVGAHFGRYVRTGRVVELSGDVITIEDRTGNLWQWSGSHRFAVGSTVTMYMDNMGTRSIYDDEIIRLRG